MKKLALGVLILAVMFSCSSDSSNDTTPAPTEVIIGTQTWKIKNLNVKSYKNGDLIPHVQDAAAWATLTTGAYCYYENQTTNGTTYGKLYNWYAVNDPRGLAPDGWHIPSRTELTTLTDFLGGAVVAGGKLKEAGTIHWKTPNADATNSSGFTAIPGGNRLLAGTFLNRGTKGYLWTSTELNATIAWSGVLTYDAADAAINSGHKSNGFSVRCIKD